MSDLGEQAINQLESGLSSWETKMNEVVTLLTTDPTLFRGGTIWSYVEVMYNAVLGFGISLLVISFFWGLLESAGTLVEMKRPENVFRTFVRVAVVEYFVVNGKDFLLKLMSVGQDIISDIWTSRVLDSSNPDSGRILYRYSVPDEIVSAASTLNFSEKLTFWLVCSLAALAMTVVSIIVILQVYGRFFKIYIYMVLAPVPLSLLAGNTKLQHVGISFIKGYVGVCLEGAVVAISVIIYDAFAATAPALDTSQSCLTMVWNYSTDIIFNMLILVTVIRTSSTLIREMLGL